MRLQWKDFAKARRKDVNLARLLPECRTLDRAQTELNWIQQEFIENEYGKLKERTNSRFETVSRWRITQACIKRGKGVPLQYVLGNQPFGHLKILCRPKVLIPRRETEEWTVELARLFSNHWSAICQTSTSSVNVVDVGTGSGCILVGLAAILSDQMSSRLQIIGANSTKWRFLGFDVDPVAKSLAQLNLKLNKGLINENQLVDAIAIKRFNLFHFSLAQRLLLQFKSWELGEDFTCQELTASPLKLYETVAMNTLFPTGKPSGFFSSVIPNNYTGHVDVLVSNPPYISSSDYNSIYKPTSVDRSARKFESKAALLGGLDYYQRICGLAEELSKGKSLDQQVKAIVMEVSGDEQMRDVMDIVRDMNYALEWRPALPGRRLPVREVWRRWNVGAWRDSSGNGRVVVAWRSPWDWMSQFVNT